MKLDALAGLIALMPLALGPLPASDRTITASLCNGGSIEIPLRREAPPEPPCAAKACHSASCRKRFDLAQ
ncbi:hypothetical protein K3152_08290 [Qipengyuania sp. 1NDH17]|uniref:Uncharacterized protein n=1 Tax=Qipengyuania polymorpha TaxID=2867234 RepID=A0ABS7J479_9SPHN|nr:hypothetical protein [Qipengyuania polymorpha]MBX7458243.1 hypothetical protein [Qipengyuania polymorpha]